MDDYDDYDDDDGADTSVDSDDEEIKFVSSKQKFKFTTFGDEDNNVDPIDGKEDSIYGVFAERKRSRAVDNPSSAPMFVRGSSKPDSEQDGTPERRMERSVTDAVQSVETTKHVQTEPVDEKAQQATESLLQQQEEANQRFLALLGRGRGEKRPRPTFSRDEGPTAMQQQGGGLGFRAVEGDGGIAPEGEGGVGFASVAGRDGASQYDGFGSIPSNFGNRRPPSPPVKVDPNLGKWEKHTKGIGMKLLAKMGYKGSGGLGAKRKVDADGPAKGGISRPVEVVVRPNNLGLGFGNFKEATKLKVNQQIEAEIRGEEKPNAKEDKMHDPSIGPAHKSSALPTTDDLMGQQLWKRGASQVSRKRKRRTIVPYAELLEKQHEPIVIDMRGPSSALNDAEVVPLAEELLHNVSILLNTYENKLHSTSHFLIASKEKLLSLQSDLDGMERRKVEARERMSKLQKVLRVVDNIDQLFTGCDGSVDAAIEAQSMVEELRGELTVEDRVALRFDQVIVPSLLGPFIKSGLDRWNPLHDSTRQSESIVSSLLNLGSGIDDDEVVKERKLAILSRDILPKLKAAYESTRWNPIDNAEAGVSLYETILGTVCKHTSAPTILVDDSNVFAAGDPDNITLTDIVVRDLLRKTIFPKIMRVLSQWKAVLDTTETKVEDGLELWLLPWMPHLDHPATLTQLTSDLKRKVRSALSCLSRGVVDTKDFLCSSIASVGPWRTLLKKETMFDLTSKYITPRLIKGLSRLLIESNPDKQDWTVVTSLSDMCGMGLIPELEFISLVEGEVLATWVEELHSHLHSPGGNSVHELARFYYAWKKNLFGSPSSISFRLLHKDEIICRIFYSALKMIEAASSASLNDTVSAIEPRPSSFREVLARRSKEVRNRNENDLERVQTKDAVEFRKRVMGRQFGATATFREVVEDFAREHDISFRPRTGGKSRTDDGKPIFLFGNVPIYLDTNVIFANQDNKWKPLAMEQLVVLAQRQ
jgi:tuftelin-interacting protein 11